MTLADLEAVALALEAERSAWAADLLRVVAAKLADAHAHAARAITATLKATPDGRPTVRRARGHPSFGAALRRLDELQDWLAGPSAVSLEGAVRDAREAFYRRAFELHRPLVPPALLVAPDPEPTGKNVALARAAAVHGYDPRVELAGPIDAAMRTLQAAAARAGASTLAARAGADVLKGWHDHALNAISRTVLSLLSDSVEYCDGEARADLIHPDFVDRPAVSVGE